MRRKENRLFKRTAAVVLAGCLFFQGFGESVAEAASPRGMVADAASPGGMVAEAASAENAAAENVLCEEGFELGTVGKWSAKEGASLSVVTDNPRSGSYCMKITGRTRTSSGAKLEIGNVLKSGHYLSVCAYVRYASGPENKKIQITMSCGGKYYTLASKEIVRGEWGQLMGSMAVPSGVDLSAATLFFETPWVDKPAEQEDLMDIYVDDAKASMIPFCDTSSYPSLKELYKDQFLIGLAVPDAVLNTPEYCQLFQQQCSSMTMENEMKPAYIMDQTASKNNLDEYREHVALNFDSYRTGMDYAKRNGIAVRGHTLVWHSQTPDWFFYEDYDVSGKRAGRELMLKRMENYIKEVIAWTETNYPGVIYAWDVVNEAVADYFGGGAAPMRQEDSLWYQIIGEDFVQKAFAYARKYTKEYGGENIKLFYNDYNEYFPAKRDGIVSLLKPVKEAGNIDGVGMQSHFDTTRPLEGDSGYMTAVRKFRDELGLQIHVTELDIGIAEGDTKESQGAYYQEFMEALLKEKSEGANITSVTFWGLTDGLSWRPEERCLLFNDDLSRKPAFEGVVKAIGNTGAAIEKIKNIGKVELTESCWGKIEEARNIYNTLTDEQKALVPADILGVLTEAEAEYKRQEELKKQEEDKKQEDDKKQDGQDKEPEVPTAPGIEKNKIYTAGDFKYKVTDARTDGKGTVSLIGVKSKAVKKRLRKINVPATVKINGKDFKVTSVGNASFSGCTKAASIIIGKNVKTIGSSSFSGCTKAASVIIGSNVTKIGAKAFYNCKKLKKITIKSTKLNSVGKNALKFIYKKAVIKCPKSKLKAYKKRLKSKGQGNGVKISF